MAHAFSCSVAFNDAHSTVKCNRRASGGCVENRKPIYRRTADDRRKPLARYGAMNSARRERLAPPRKRHHHLGHDRGTCRVILTVCTGLSVIVVELKVANRRDPRATRSAPHKRRSGARGRCLFAQHRRTRRYLIGEAVMRRIEKSERDPATIADIRALRDWIEAWLPTTSWTPSLSAPA